MPRKTKTQTNLDKYAEKLYKGELKVLKEKLKREGEDIFDTAIRWLTTDDETTKKGKRLSPTSSQGKAVIEKCNRECVVCGASYSKEPEDFQIHHIDGDRTNTVTKNLALMCNKHHKKLHTAANAKLKDYRVEQGRKKKNKTNLFGFTDG